MNYIKISIKNINFYNYNTFLNFSITLINIGII